MKGCVYFHQGWTDIINCLPLVNYYADKYDKLILIIREDAKEIARYYTRNMDNISLLCKNKYDIDLNPMCILQEIPPDYDLLFHGNFDSSRNDKYKNIFSKSIFYAEGFYTFYEIPFNEKINSFNFIRDFELEENEYLSFIKIYGKDYSLYHISSEVENFNEVDIYKPSIDINGLSNNIFSCIKILENAKELHLMDSLWASFCYLLDAKYNLFSNKKIYLYPFKKRSGGLVETYKQSELSPINLKNWVIKNT